METNLWREGKASSRGYSPTVRSIILGNVNGRAVALRFPLGQLVGPLDNRTMDYMGLWADPATRHFRWAMEAPCEPKGKIQMEIER